MASREPLDILVFLSFTCILGWISETRADMRSKIFCDREEIELHCPDSSILSVYGVFYRILEPGSSWCKHVNVSQSPCNPKQISRIVRASCQGKSKCNLPTRPLGTKATECLKSLYLTIWYDCGEERAFPDVGLGNKMKPPKTAYYPSTVNPKILVQNGPSPTGSRTKSNYESDLSYFSYFFWTLVSAALAFDYIQARPRHLILCLILSASVGIVLLIVGVLLMACCQKLREQKDEESDSNMDISAPIVSSAKDIHEPEPREHAPLLRAENAKLVKPDVVDEDTRTEDPKVDRSHTVPELSKDTEDGAIQDKALSEKEAKELGHLVEIMRFYNSKLSSSQHSLPQLKDIVERGNSQNNVNNVRTKYVNKSHTLPRQASGDELDDLFKQLSAMSPKRKLPEKFDNCPVPNELGLYENLDSPVFTTSTPKKTVEFSNSGTLGRQGQLLPDKRNRINDNLPANYAFLEKSASTLLKEINQANDNNDFLSSRSSSQTSEIPNNNGEPRLPTFTTFQSGRNKLHSIDSSSGHRQAGTLDRPHRHERSEVHKDHFKEISGQGLKERTNPSSLSTGFVRQNSSSSSTDHYESIGRNRPNIKQQIPLTTFNPKSHTLTYDTPRMRDGGHYKNPSENARVRILQQDL